MQQASYLEGGLLLWILPLYLHVTKKSNDDDDVETVLMTGQNLSFYGKIWKITLIFLTYETEFVLCLAMLENSVLPMG